MAKNIEELRAMLPTEGLKRVDARVSRTLELMAAHQRRSTPQQDTKIFRCAEDDGDKKIAGK